MLDGQMRLRLFFRGLQLGIITILDSLSLAPISNMHVRHEVWFFIIVLGKEVVDCVNGKISIVDPICYNTLHNTPLLHPQNYGPKT
jgi:hypothetical protein